MTIELHGLITKEGNFTGEILGQNIERFWIDTTLADILDMFGVIDADGVITTIRFVNSQEKAVESEEYWAFRNKYNL